MDYSNRVKEIRKYLKNHTLTEFEDKQGIVDYDFEGAEGNYHAGNKEEAEMEIETKTLNDLEKIALSLRGVR